MPTTPRPPGFYSQVVLPEPEERTYREVGLPTLHAPSTIPPSHIEAISRHIEDDPNHHSLIGKDLVVGVDAALGGGQTVYALMERTNTGTRIISQVTVEDDDNFGPTTPHDHGFVVYDPRNEDQQNVFSAHAAGAITAEQAVELLNQQPPFSMGDAWPPVDNDEELNLLQRAESRAERMGTRPAPRAAPPSTVRPGAVTGFQPGNVVRGITPGMQASGVVRGEIMRTNEQLRAGDPVISNGAGFRKWVPGDGGRPMGILMTSPQYDGTANIQLLQPGEAAVRYGPGGVPQHTPHPASRLPVMNGAQIASALGVPDVTQHLLRRQDRANEQQALRRLAELEEQQASQDRLRPRPKPAQSEPSKQEHVSARPSSDRIIDL